MRTTRIITCLLSFACATLCAQETQGEETYKLKVGLSGSVDLCNEMLYYSGQYQQPGDAFAFLEDPSLGFSSGLTANYYLNGNWSLVGGVRYTEHNIVTGPIPITDVAGNTSGAAKFVYHTRFLDIPLGIQYGTNSAKRMMFIANAVVAPGYAMGEWVELDYTGDGSQGIHDSQHKLQIENYRSLSVKAELYAGVGINLNRFQVQVLPQGRINLLKATSDSPINRRYRTTGVEFRILYNL